MSFNYQQLNNLKQIVVSPKLHIAEGCSADIKTTWSEP